MKAKFYVQGLLILISCGLWGLANPVISASDKEPFFSKKPFSDSFDVSERTNRLVLTESSFGPLELSKDIRISKNFLEEKFPGHLVTQEYLQGDSPDFFYFTIRTKDGTRLCTIQSFLPDTNIELQNQEARIDLHVDLLEVYSPEILDSYGIKPGDKVSDIVKLRGEDLDFGLGHIAMVFIGKEKIFYNILVPSQVINIPGPFKDKRDKIKQIAIRENWSISSISWPKPAWN